MAVFIILRNTKGSILLFIFTVSGIFRENKLDLSIEISYLLTYFNFDGTTYKTFDPAYIPNLVMLSKQYNKEKIVPLKIS
jgi:hypothetical protein